MTTVATTDRPAAHSARAGTLVERLLEAAPLVSVYLVLVVVYVWQGLSHDSPWLFSDELEYTQLSRSIAETGEAARRGEPAGFGSLYTYLLAPVWLIDDVEAAYAAAKYLGAFVMAAALFPAYGLARLVAPRGLATLAAVGTATVPVLAYSRLIYPDVLAYPYAALTFFLLAKALATWRPAWLAGAAVAVAVAPFVRTQFVIFPAVAAGAVLVALWLGERARRWRRDWGVVRWALAAAGLALIVHIAHEQAIRRSELYYVATTLPDRMRDFEIWAAGAFVIGIGLFPALLALTALWRPRDLGEPAYRALVSLLVPSIVGFGLYTTVKAVHLSTVFANVVAERNLVFLSPLVFAATALFLHRPAANPVVLVAAAALLAFLVVDAPLQLVYYPYFDAPGLAVLATFNRELRLDDPTIERMLVWIVVGSMLVAAAAAFARRARIVAQGAAVALAVACIGWNLTGEFSFGNGINGLANRLRSSVPEPPSWVDNVTKGDETIYVGQGITNGNPIQLTEFWNRSVQHVASLDGTAPGPGPAPVLVPRTRDGRVANDPGVEYLVTNTPGVEPVGELVYPTGDWRVYRINGPIRLRSSITGVYADGWTGPSASYNRFGTGQKGVLDVLVSRTGWQGEDRPGNVRLRVGSLVPQPLDVIANPCRNGACVDVQPEIGTLYAQGTWRARAERQQLFHFPVTTPFRLEITVDPTFSPLEFGGTDLRQLGVRLAVVFKPAP